MADSRLIVAHETGPRDRRPYELTDAGRAEFQRWLHTEPGPEQIRYPLLLRIRLGEHLSNETLSGFVANHRQQHQQRLAQYQAVQPAAAEHGDPYALATLQFGIRYEQAVLDWLDSLPSTIGGRTPDESPP